MRALNRRYLTALLAISMAALALSPGIVRVAGLPENIVLSAGSVVDVPDASLMTASVTEGGAALENGRLLAGMGGDARVTYSLLGIVPVRTVNVSVKPDRVLIPGGQSIGIAIDTAGVVVVGASDVGSIPSPARLAGLRAGDIIQKVNGTAIIGAEALTDGLDGGTVTLDVLRDGKPVTCKLNPALDGRDGQWRLGAWVRDSTAGVGTLTFSDPETGLYGALGHAITDLDTSIAMPVGEGELYRNNVVDVTPSAQGRPGEMAGDFVFNTSAIGSVERNTPGGVFGTVDAPMNNALYPEGLPVARRAEIHPGPAKLLTTVDAGGVREYDCEITRVSERGMDTRELVVKITDSGLIEKTGGIVQGMSGSPILQDGRLAGALTHVMVNDPRMGYGISIEGMLEAAET